MSAYVDILVVFIDVCKFFRFVSEIYKLPKHFPTVLFVRIVILFSSLKIK